MSLLNEMENASRQESISFRQKDVVGLTTAYDVCLLQGALQKNQNLLDIAAFIKKNYVDQGRLGVRAGKGFYDYPNPAYESPDFLK